MLASVSFKSLVKFDRSESSVASAIVDTNNLLLIGCGGRLHNEDTDTAVFSHGKYLGTMKGITIEEAATELGMGSPTKTLDLTECEP